jgi:Polyketide cyclase / dehydrase and lipid transport
MTTKVEKTTTVGVPVSTAYNQWTQFEDFPQFMGGVTQVDQLDDTRLHWVAEIAGVKRQWDATILEQRPDEKVAWAADEGATNAGAVYFTPVGAGQTLVRLELEFEPEGLVEKVGDALNVVGRQAESDLEKFKTFIESRHDETGGWRGDVGDVPVGTPTVQAATSQGDSGKAGISGKAAVAGVTAVAAGAAAVAATRRGSDEDEAQRVTEVETVVPVATTEEVEPVAVETLEPIEDVGPVPPSAVTEDEAVIVDVPPPTRSTGSGSPQGGTI